ncbi:Cytochrome P450 CYP4/CYP19/CYP26 subfamily [Handroanthus impetiginosus]|uniref:Cytochrome P450 CYP4/CYP19/CYP26 subfamily n=1 Tax=Handroanthus impetiginosus TaxID=429701 RepID=A0A2G9HM89_9LAMI|nr:Cytochrome P450 CYP4/CYP19/CYP26 subfamily [Handroanthus impetiginosus]
MKSTQNLSNLFGDWESVNSVLIITAFLALLVLLLFIVLNGKPRNKGLNLPPGSYGWPILGETMEFLRTRNDGVPEKFVKERMVKYETQVFKTSLLGESMAVLCGPAGNKFLFSNENKLVTVWWPSSVRKLLGKCIATTGGIEGMKMRKLVSYFVSPDAFTKLYIKTMDIVSQQHIKTQWQGKEELRVFPAIKLYMFELACRLFVSIEDPVEIKKQRRDKLQKHPRTVSIPLDFPGTRFYKASRATAAIKRELQMIVRQRREVLEQKTPLASQDLLSHLLVCPDEDGKFMSESVIINNILLLLFAGHDTSSSLITILIKTLAEYPQVYEKVLAEQKEIASSKEPGEFLQWDDIQKMRYSWSVVCETMRLWPPVIGAFREALVDINYGGYNIPKGWKFYLNVPLTHGDSSFFPDNTKFEPSRFDGAGPIPYSFVPFGGGPRMCLGKELARLEILTFLHNIILRFRWNLLIPGEKITCDPIPAPVKGLPIRLHPHDEA